MTARVAHRLAREHSSSPCARCLSIVDITAGEWHATEPGDHDRPVWDHCARRDAPRVRDGRRPPPHGQEGGVTRFEIHNVAGDSRTKAAPASRATWR